MRFYAVRVAVVASIILIISALNLFAEANEPLTLPDFVRKTQAHYPLLKKQHARVEEAIAAKHEAIAGFLPKFTGVSSWSTGNDPVYVFGTLLKQGAFTQNDFQLGRLNSPEARTNFSYGVEGRWVLFDAFDTISRVRIAGHAVDSEKSNEEYAQMEVSLLAVEAFYRAVLETNLERFAGEIITSSKKDLSEAQSLNEKGMVLGADFYAANVNGGILERMRNRFQRDSKSSRILLNILMGEDPLVERSLDYEILPLNAESKGFRQWLDVAYLYRKDFEAIDAAIRGAESEVFRQKMSFLPKISAFGSVEDNTHDWQGDSKNYLLGVKGELDLFDGTYGARNERAALKLKEAIEEKNSLRDAIMRALSEENARYETLTTDLPLAERMLQDAKNAMQMTEKLYREGKKSVADLLEIRRVYLEMALMTYETRFYIQTSYSRLLFLSGTLDRTSLDRIAAGLKKR